MNSELLPDWVVWSPRSFPDTNLLLLTGRRPALIDTGFVGHADQTAAWVRFHTGDLDLVVNTHWHADHVGGNALLQAAGVRIAASAIDAAALTRPDPSVVWPSISTSRSPLMSSTSRWSTGRSCRSGTPNGRSSEPRVILRATWHCGSPTNGC